ncbi:hypothetical protein BGY98DRAFT_268058 [Russula aff. rugulosa BPL654]|nr:hypothetical protein BGY98DRAFT_268058 [Russula aff. rugulosa BPL654]
MYRIALVRLLVHVLMVAIDRILCCAYRRTPLARINQQPTYFIRTLPLRRRRASCRRDGDRICPFPQEQHDVGRRQSRRGILMRLVRVWRTSCRDGRSFL